MHARTKIWRHRTVSYTGFIDSALLVDVLVGASFLQPILLHEYSLGQRSTATATSKLYGGVVCRIDGCRCRMVGVDQIVVFTAFI